MLSNAYFLAKFRFDTAENEPAKNLQNFVNFPNFANPKYLRLVAEAPAAGHGGVEAQGAAERRFVLRRGVLGPRPFTSKEANE